MREDAALSIPRANVLVAGNIMMLSLLPIIQRANHIFSHGDVMIGVLTAQAILTLLMLVGRIRIRQRWIDHELAVKLVEAMRGGIL